LCSPIKTVRRTEFFPQNHPSRDCHALQSSALQGDAQHYNNDVLHDNPKLHRLVATEPVFCLHLVQPAGPIAGVVRDLPHPDTSSDEPDKAIAHQTVLETVAMVALPD